jgi:hypothetical protein
MCVSLGPAKLSETILYGAEVKVAGKTVHVLGYQNTAENLDDGPNAMILPFPAKPGTMTEKNVIDTAACPKILKDMAEAVRPRTRGLPMSFGADAVGKGLPVRIFESGIYTVLLAENAKDIPQALNKVDAAKRPKLNKEIFEAYAKWYPDWPVALCCFNNAAKTNATPMLWWYEPLNEQALFLPALDSHTGGVPDLKANVDVDHTLVVGVSGMPHGNVVRFSDPIPSEVRPYLFDRVAGNKYRATMGNGDFTLSIRDLQAGVFMHYRLTPPGAFAK